MADDFCPYLGSVNSEDEHTRHPSRWNLCYALEEPQSISLLDQRGLCLGANYFECPLLSPDFVDTEADVPPSRGVKREAGRALPSQKDEKQERGSSLFIVAVVVLVLILLCSCLCLCGLVVFYFFSGG
jgi:hypothetical protein